MNLCDCFVNLFKFMVFFFFKVFQVGLVFVLWYVLVLGFFFNLVIVCYNLRISCVYSGIFFVVRGLLMIVCYIGL